MSEPEAPQVWTVYVLQSTPLNRTYVGITLDIKRRLSQHNGLKPGGARATRAGRPWMLAASYGPYPSKGQALRIERQIKRLRGAARLRYNAPPPESHPAEPTNTESAESVVQPSAENTSSA